MQKTQLPALSSIRHVHIIGVCGTLMGAFAAYLRRRGLEVTGSDQNIYPPMSDVLKEAQVKLCLGYAPENLNTLGKKPDLVVIGNVIGAQNPEARAAIDGGYAYSSLPEAMEKLFLVETRNLVVSGTHGKTTTSSLLAHVLTQAKKNPSYFIGGVSQDLPCSFQVSSTDRGTYFVLEGDEYDTAFWDKVPKFNHYLPDDVILTSVEYDHADIYPDMSSVVRAFEGLVHRIRPGGKLIACLDYAVIGDLIKLSQVPVITYASKAGEGVRFSPGQIRTEGELTRFEILDKGHAIDEIALRMSGNHNVMNALSVWIECQELGVPRDQVRAGLLSFHGVKRRQETRGEPSGVLVIDDFAHHPTAVRETLKGLKARYAGRRLIAVFEPRSATSRRKVFQAEYAKAFSEAQAVFIATPFDQTKIAQADQFSSDQLVEDIVKNGTQAFLMNTVASGVAEVAKFAQKGDVIAVLSNGGFEGFIPKLLASLV